jgi:mannan endo-1,4-beta-mannosidase
MNNRFSRRQLLQAASGFAAAIATSSLSWNRADSTLAQSSSSSGNTFQTRGRYLYDGLGNKVVLRGVNKMTLWDNADPTGSISFPEIRKTGANAVRIPWAIRKDLKPGTSDTDPNLLDAIITNAKANRLVPVVDMHDATGKWERLPDMVNYWIQPTIVQIIQKHEEYLLVNIANECGGNDDQGNDLVSKEQFIAGYSQAVQKMRSAGIHTPLIIDASDSGKHLDRLDETAMDLMAADPENNLLFSVHLYWSIFDGADANFIRSKLENAVSLGYPLMVGEFSGYGGWAGVGQSVCGPNGKIDYETIIKVCHEHEIGWLAWEWGPGNDIHEAICANVDMTVDSRFDTLKPGWAEEVAISSPHSIKNTSITPSSM